MSQGYSWRVGRTPGPATNREAAAWTIAAGFFLLVNRSRGKRAPTFWRWTDDVVGPAGGGGGAAAPRGGGAWTRLPSGAGTGAGGVRPPASVVGVRGDPSVGPPPFPTGLTATDVTGGRLWLYGGDGDWRRRTAVLWEYTVATETWAVLGGVPPAGPPTAADEAAAAVCAPPVNGSMGGGGGAAATPWPCPVGVDGGAEGDLVYSPADDTLYLVRKLRGTIGWIYRDDDVSVWAYHLRSDGWSLVVASAARAPGGPPAGKIEAVRAMATPPDGLVVLLVSERGLLDFLQEAWRLNTTTGGWTLLTSRGPHGVSGEEKAAWTTDRYALTHLPGAVSREGPDRSRLDPATPGLSVNGRDPRGTLLNRDRLLAYDAPAAAAAAAALPGPVVSERQGVFGRFRVGTGPAAVPGRRFYALSGGTLVGGTDGRGGGDGGRGGDGPPVVGYLYGGSWSSGPFWKVSTELWRLTLDAPLPAVFPAANRGAVHTGCCHAHCGSVLPAPCAAGLACADSLPTPDPLLRYRPDRPVFGTCAVHGTGGGGATASAPPTPSPSATPSAPPLSPSPPPTSSPTLSPTPTPTPPPTLLPAQTPTSPPPTPSLSPTPSPSTAPVATPSAPPGGPAGGSAPLYAPCGGLSHPRATPCRPPLVCVAVNRFYSQCRVPPARAGQLGPWARCGGEGFVPPAGSGGRCSGAYECTRLSRWYSHCAPTASLTG